MTQTLAVVSGWLLPLFVFLVVTYGFLRKVDVFDCFVEGVREGLNLIVRIAPYVITVYMVVGIFRATGAERFVTRLINPVTNLLAIPPEVVPLMIIRPLSGPAALGVTLDLMDKFGPDSFIGLLASTIDGSADTTLYVIAVYFASVGIRQIRYSLKVALLADLAGFITTILVCNWLFR